ncbi:MAG: SCO family protein [Candidatus Acidoferrales bacterium]
MMTRLLKYSKHLGGLAGAALLLFLVVAGASAPVRGQNLSRLGQIGLEQRLNHPLPLELEFRDEAGRTVRLGDYFGERPVVLALVYYRCPQLCPMVLTGMVKSLRTLSFEAGQEFEVVTVSIDPSETPEIAAEKKRLLLRQYDRPGTEAGWHLLTGEEAAIQRLAEAVGFRYFYDPNTKLYAHAAGLMLATPEGRLARYFYGIEHSGRDLRLGLVEASQNQIGSVVDQVLLYCYHYDPTTGKYGLVIMNILRVAGLATVLALGIFLVVSLRRERRQARAQPSVPSEKVEPGC